MRIDYPRAGRTGVRRWLPSWRQLVGLVFLGVITVTAAFVVLYQQVHVPTPNDFGTAQRNVVMFADNKTEIGWQGEYNRQIVPFERIPVQTREAVLAAEDREFYAHGAISPLGLARALINNVRGGSTQGGSTITQQYVKNYYLTQSRTLQRKVRELVIAMKIERQQSKDAILANYLNTIYFGRSSYGVQTAARAYFGVDAQRLNLAQSAALATLIRAPGLYDPTLGPQNKQRFDSRFRYVLDGMLDKGWITQAQHDQTKPPAFKPKSDVNRFAGPNGYLMDAAMRELTARGFTQDQIDQGGLRVITTIDVKAQNAAVKAVVDNMSNKDAAGVHVGLTAVRPGTGEIVAMYGGPDYVTQSFNVAMAGRKPGGSTFKPFALAAALEQGIGLKTTYDGRNGIQVPGYDFKVTNDNNQSFGRIDLIKATEDSVNTVYVQLGADVGAARVYDALVRAGIPKDSPGLAPYPSIVLGPASVSTVDMADAFATLAAGGTQVDPYLIKEVRSSDGAVLYRADPAPRQAFPPRVVSDVTYALRKVVTNGTGYRAQALGRPAAGKTGTAENDGKIVSTWFAGYTPQLAASVLIYRESKDGLPQDMNGYGGYGQAIGGRYPAMVWTAFMKGALQGQKVMDFPAPSWIGGTPTPTPTPTPTLATPNATPTTTPTPTPTPVPTSTPVPTPSGTLTSRPNPTLTPIPTAPVTPPGGGGGAKPRKTRTPPPAG